MSTTEQSTTDLVPVIKIGRPSNAETQEELLEELSKSQITYANSKLTGWLTKARTSFYSGSLVGNADSTYRPSDAAKRMLSQVSAGITCLWAGRKAWQNLFPGYDEEQLRRVATEVSLKSVFPSDLVTSEHIDSFAPKTSFDYKEREKLEKAAESGRGWSVDLWKQDKNPWKSQSVLRKTTGITMSKHWYGGGPDSANTAALRDYVQQRTEG